VTAAVHFGVLALRSVQIAPGVQKKTSRKTGVAPLFAIHDKSRLRLMLELAAFLAVRCLQC